MTWADRATKPNLDSFFNPNQWTIDAQDQFVFCFASHGGQENNWVFEGDGVMIADCDIKDKINGLLAAHNNPALIIFESCKSGCLVNPAYANSLTGPKQAATPGS